MASKKKVTLQNLSNVNSARYKRSLQSRLAGKKSKYKDGESPSSNKQQKIRNWEKSWFSK